MKDRRKRRLIRVPVVHSQTDLGSMRDSVGHVVSNTKEAKAWERHVRAVDEGWDEIDRRMAAADLDYRHVRLYQDGLPICGYELDIVRELAQNNSPNHRLLLELIEKGARLTGTESPELLVMEYALMQEMVSAAQRGGTAGAALAKSKQDEARRLLQKRDRFIAGRINETLRPSETGLIFLGLLHSLEHYLATDIALFDLNGLLA
jgi:hypothetical protein